MDGRPGAGPALAWSVARSAPSLSTAASRALGSLGTCPACLAAAAGPAGVCDACRAWLEAAVAALPPPAGRWSWLGPYAGPWERLVIALKHGGSRRLGAFLGALVAARSRGWEFRPAAVCHVPAAPSRLAERGFDQAALLAAQVASLRSMPHLSALARAPGSTSQKGLARASRAVNVAGAYRATRPVRGSVLLVDDVLTTGATFRSCAAALMGAGATDVRGAFVARAVRGSAAPKGEW